MGQSKGKTMANRKHQRHDKILRKQEISGASYAVNGYFSCGGYWDALSVQAWSYRRPKSQK